MPTSAVLSAQLCAGPAKPIICLDNCDILELIQWQSSGLTFS
jgi:hypothetical protein